MNLAIHPSWALRLMLVFSLGPAEGFSSGLTQKNPPVRLADAESPVAIWDVDLKLANALPRNFCTTDDPLKASAFAMSVRLRYPPSSEATARREATA